MSKGGGAGKVYFILYLAVLLELLIIIVERDDAEEELRKEKLALEQKRKQIQLIAETILNSLRGSVTSVSSTSNQSMVLGDKNEATGREFNVRVRVADPSRDTVKELDLHLLRNKSEMAVINLANDSVQFPRRVEGHDYIYTYHFKPGFGAGEYQLHFDAKTNQIVGVTAAASLDDTVKIGEVHLTVKDLKEVKDGITENITLKGYIDSLLNGQYENFATNIGANEFTINVKPPSEVDQLHILPQEPDFAAFPGLELPNPVKIEGATIGGPQGVNITKVDGPGEIRKIDSNFFWIWKPELKDLGTTATVKLTGKANRNGATKDIAQTQFNVIVNKLEPATVSHYFPENKKTHDATPYTMISFKANQKFANLDGTYKTELYIGGTKVKETNEATIEWTPEFLKDEGKPLEIKTYYKSNFMKDYVQIDDQTFKIGPPPLLAVGDNDPEIGDALTIKAAFGIPGNLNEIGADHLDVESGGLFGLSAKKTTDPSHKYFEVQMITGKAASVIKKKDGEDRDITVTEPLTHQSKTFTIHITPKVQTKRGAGAGGGGIH
jgi:hypothetical protein